MRFAMATGAALVLAACSGEADTGGEDAPAEIAAADEAGTEIQPQAGLYKKTGAVTRFEVPGMPEAQIAQIRATMESAYTAEGEFCITPEQAEKGAEEFVRLARSEGLSDECQFSQFEMAGDSYSTEIVCADGSGNAGTIRNTGTITETEQNSKMLWTQNSPDFPEGKLIMEATSKIERVGECEG